MQLITQPLYAKLDNSSFDALAPGAGLKLFKHLAQHQPNDAGRQKIYFALSSIRSAIRARAVDHRRSTDLGDISTAKAVSLVE